MDENVESLPPTLYTRGDSNNLNFRNIVVNNDKDDFFSDGSIHSNIDGNNYGAAAAAETHEMRLNRENSNDFSSSMATLTRRLLDSGAFDILNVATVASGSNDDDDGSLDGPAASSHPFSINDTFNETAAFAIASKNTTEPICSGDLTYLSLPALIFVSLAFFVIIAASVCGNLLVIFAVYKNLRLRSKTNFFIVSLAFADLLVAILAMTFNAAQMTLSPAVVWSFVGPFFCKFWLASDIFFSTASTLHLCAIAVDRYTAILHPFRYMDIMKKRIVSGILAAIWVVSAALAYGPIFTDVYVAEDHEISLDQPIEKCNLHVNVYFAVVSSCITFWIPGVVMSAIYIRVFIEANRQERAISSERKRLQSQMQQNYSFKKERLGDSHQNLSLPPTPENQRERKDTGTDSIQRRSERGERGSRMDRRLKRERKAARTLAIIMGAFIVCWLPFFTWYTTDFVWYSIDLIPCSHAWLIDLFFWIGYLNSALNPIIYAYFNRDFRHAFKKLLHCDAVSGALAGAVGICRLGGAAGGRRSERNGGENGFMGQHNPLQPLQDNSSN